MSQVFKGLHWSREINIKRYLMPETLPEALELLAKYDGNAQVIAGGTDVIPQLRHGNFYPVCRHNSMDETVAQTPVAVCPTKLVGPLYLELPGFQAFVLPHSAWVLLPAELVEADSFSP